MLVPEPHQAGRLPDGVVQLVPGLSLVLRAKGNVLIDRFLKELVLRVLEDQAHLEPDVPYLFRLRPDVPALQQNLPGRRL